MNNAASLLDEIHCRNVNTRYIIREAYNVFLGSAPFPPDAFARPEEPVSSPPSPGLPSPRRRRCRDVAIMYNAAGNKNKSN